MDGEADGKPVPQALMERGVVPFIKIDKGLEDEADGVQLMKPMPGLDALLARAQALGRVRHQGALGDQARHRRRHRRGGGAAVRGRASRSLRHGLMPIIEPECRHQERRARASATRSCSRKSSSRSMRLPDGEQVMLKLTLPAKAEPVRAAGRSSAGAARRRAVRRLSAAPRRARAGEEPRHDRQLQPRSARGSAPPDERRRVRRARWARAIDDIYSASSRPRGPPRS